MPNLTSVTLTAGVPTAGTGTVGTIDNVTGTAGAPSVPVLTVQGVASGTAQPVSGTVSANATQTGTWTVQPGNTANTTAWKVDGSAVIQPVSAASLPLPTGAATAAKQPALGTSGTPSTDVITVQGAGSMTPLKADPGTPANWGLSSQGALTSLQVGPLIQGAVTTAAPTYTTAQTFPLSLDTAGNLRVNVVTGGGSGGTSSTVGAAAPSTATAVGFSDGTNMVLGRVKAASTAPVATDPAIVVAISPNSVNANGSATSANSAPVVIASDQAAIAVKAASSTFVAGSIADLAHGQGAMSASVPVVIASDQSNIPTILKPTATASGTTASRVNAAATTNATNLKASAGQLYSIDVFNVAAYNVFLKLYNKASAPTVGTDTPIMTIPIQAGGGYSKTWLMGLTFATGISYAITKLQADSDTTAVVAGDLTGNTTWI